MKNTSLLLNTDSYKASHFRQYPPGTEYVSSYIESRGGDYDATLFFGLQAFLKAYLTDPITAADVDEAESFWTEHGLPFNRAGWMRIVNVHRGRLPLRIQAVKEGTVLPTRNVLVQVCNTDPALPWLTSYIETALLRAVWYPTTVATRSLMNKRTIRKYLALSGADVAALLPFRLHDFGARGASSLETAGLGGAAHLINFMGSDNVEGILVAKRYYGAGMAGFSIPAAEHSTICAWGQDGEAAAYRNMLTQFGGPGKLVAVVSDSYDIYNAVINIWGKTLREEVEKMGGTLVVRPDSGEPHVVPVRVVELLGNAFGFTTNAAGFKVLPACVRVIQGDGINDQSIERILLELTRAGWSAENIAFGMGGELLQTMNRDTLRFAMKASAIKRAGDTSWHRIAKNPATDPRKASKGGRLALVHGDAGYQTMLEANLDLLPNLLEEVWLDGELVRDQGFDQIRQIAERSELDLASAVERAAA